MTYRDIRDAEQALYGGPTYSMSVRHRPPGKEERLDDMAQAWIDGKVDEVMNFVAVHYATVRARMKPPVRRQQLEVPGESGKEREVVIMLNRGCNYREIQATLQVSPNKISRLKRGIARSNTV